MELLPFSSVQFSRSVISDSLWLRGLQHSRPPCPSPTPRVYSDSCHWAVMPSNHLILCRSLLLPSIFPWCWESSSHQVAKVLEFQLSISPSNECSGLISFRMDWLDLLAVQETLKSSPTPQFKNINSLALSFLYSPTLLSILDHWKNYSRY